MSTDLATKYKQIQLELESANQALYDCRRQAKTTQSLEAEYQEEIRLIQNQATERDQVLKMKIQQLEEDIQNSRATNNDHITSLEKELLDKEQENDNLKKNLDDLIRVSEMEVPVVDNKLMEEVTQLKEENISLREHILELENELQETQQQNLVLEERVKQFQCELEEHREILNCKREELEEIRALNKNLSDEVTQAQTELESMRSCPLDQGSRGNSLFAEVDDRRLKLQENMGLMKSRYLDMKRDRASLLQQISTLRHENATLIAEREGEIKERQDDEERIIESYKNQIETLKALNESYKKQLNEQPTSEDIAGQGFKLLENMLKTKSAEIESWRQKLLERSLTYTSLSYELAEANRKIRQLTLEILNIKHDLEEERLKNKENELQGSIETAPAKVNCEECSKRLAMKSIVKNISEEEKENDGSKKVQFAENTAEPHVTDRRKLRKGAKVIVSKPIIFP